MNRLIAFLFSLALAAPQAWGQASLLPNAKQQFIDNIGAPLAAGTVDLYVPNTNTRKNTWTNSAESSQNTNPVVLDAGGRAVIYGQGSYRQVVKDALGNVIWDQVTAAPASGTSTFLTDAAPVGTLLPYAGIALPANYLWAYGQEVSRTGATAALYGAITIQQTVAPISGNTTVGGFSDTTQIRVGAVIEGPCLSANTTVVSVGATFITVSAVATSSGSCAIRVFPFGHGDGSTTFNVPDMRGRVPAGRDNIGNVAAGNMTPTFCTSSGSPPLMGLGSVCGSQSRTMVVGDLVPHAHGAPTIIDSQHLHGVPIQQSGLQSPIGAGQTPMIVGGTSNTNNAFTGITLSATGTTGGGSPFSLVQPTVIANYIVKYALESPSGAGGVVSIQGMTGDITCSGVVTCAGNNISATGLGTGTVQSVATGQGLSGGTITATGTLTTDAGVDTNTLNARSSNYTLVTSDCGKTLSLGGSAFYTLTVAAATGFPNTCSVVVINTDSGRAKAMSISGISFPTGGFLWPQQTFTLKNQSGAWTVIGAPIRWFFTSPVTIFVNTALGSDNNDGLGTGTGNAMQTLSGAVSRVCTYFDANTQVTVQLTTGQTHASQPLCNYVGNIQPSTNNPVIVGDASSCAAAANYVIDGGINPGLTPTGITTPWQVKGVSLTSSVLGTAVEADAKTLLYLGPNVVFPGISGFHVRSFYLSFVEFLGDYCITGGATVHWNHENQGQILIQPGHTITITGTPTFGIFNQGKTLGLATWIGTTFSGPALGQRFTCETGAGINTGGGGAAFLPGSVGGVCTNPGWYQ